MLGGYAVLLVNAGPFRPTKNSTHEVENGSLRAASVLR
jgi:hypothetical protein